MGSEKFSISNPELRRFLKNTLVFIAPVGLIYLVFVGNNLQVDGVSLSDFVPNQLVLGSIVLYVVNVTTDFLRKFVPNTQE